MFSLEEEGAYIRLLCFCWQHGSIPSDPAAVARLIGKGASTTLATVVLAMFQPSEEGRMVHDRLEAERAKQAVWREKSAAGGRKSAEIRKGGLTTVQPPSEGCLPNGANQTPTLRLLSSSPSSSPITVSKENKASPAAPCEIPEILRTPQFDSAWADWKAHCREKKKPLKPGTQAESAQLRKMAEIGPVRAVAAIRHSIGGNYQGLFEPNNGAPQTGQTELEPRFNQF